MAAETNENLEMKFKIALSIPQDPFPFPRRALRERTRSWGFCRRAAIVEVFAVLQGTATLKGIGPANLARSYHLDLHGHSLIINYDLAARYFPVRYPPDAIHPCGSKIQ